MTTSAPERKDSLATASTRRWVHRASRLENLLIDASFLVAAALAALVLAGSHPVYYVVIAGVFTAAVAYRHIGRGDEVLMVIDGAILWGNTIVPRESEGIKLEALASVRFFRRNDGGGAIELTASAGDKVFLPGVFTDPPGLSDEILTAIREEAPELRIEIV